MKKTTTFIAAAALFAGTAAFNAAFAGSSNCEVVYGGGYYGGEICDEKVSFVVDKQVQRPTKGGSMVNNLGVDDEKFAPGSTVNFKITVKNTGSKAIEDLNVIDTLPTHLTWVSGGKRDGQKVSYVIEKLDAGKSQTVDLSAKVANGNDLPKDKSVNCVTNNVKASKDSYSATDSTQICIENGMKQKDGGPVVQQTPPLKQTPQTGPGALSLAALIPAGALGLFLNRRAIR